MRQAQQISNGDDEYDESTCDPDLLFFGESILTRVVSEDVVLKHRPHAQELAVERRHNGGQNPSRQKPREEVLSLCFHKKRQYRIRIARQWRSRWDKLCCGPNTDQHTWHPNNHDENGVSHDWQLEAIGTLGRQPVLEDVREHPHRQWNQ